MNCADLQDSVEMASVDVAQNPVQPDSGLKQDLTRAKTNNFIDEQHSADKVHDGEQKDVNADTTKVVDSTKNGNVKVFDAKKYVEAPQPKTNPWNKTVTVSVANTLVDTDSGELILVLLNLFHHISFECSLSSMYSCLHMHSNSVYLIH